MYPTLSNAEKGNTQVKYKALSKDEETDNGIYSDSNLQAPTPYQNWKVPAVTSFNIILFLVSLTLFYNSLYPTARQNWALEQTSFYSPLFDHIKIQFVEKVVQGTLFNEHNLLLRADPSPEVDEAWSKLTDVGVVIISGEEVSKLGKDPKKTVKAPLAWGYGSDAHLAQSDGQHALHCLNAIRKYAYKEHYYPLQTSCPSNTSSSSLLDAFNQVHLSHCLHVLLQTLSCDFSTDMITHNWMATQDFPFPDFAINKKCKDHSRFLEWQEKKKISTEMWV
ncbi:hypothetical protein HYFRA_00010666 [Hymenoscyphus fraxineus]|uniref:Uncharacterized protein n=1 Tax=Hymenoscyphus fraxineus TaxID=746836 RepID=A0A9N9PZX8_9HELO|nr:hypothetical protein HYFRA_00010666 [Hymenoscyphus fraxineus]